MGRTDCQTVLLCLAFALPGAALAELPELDCVIEPHELVDVGSAAQGLIQHVYVERNDTVEAGQTLAELHSGVEKASVALARERARVTSEIETRRVNLALSKRKHGRIDKLFQQNAVSFDQKDELETDALVSGLLLRQAQEKRRIAELELGRAEEVLKLRTIRSPFSGVVVERYKSAGEFIVDDRPLLKLAQLDPLRVEVIAPVTMYGQVRAGMSAKVTPEAPEDGTFTATVETVDRVVDAASGTFGIRLDLPNAEGQLPAGLRCRVRFLPGTEPTPDFASGAPHPEGGPAHGPATKSPPAFRNLVIAATSDRVASPAPPARSPMSASAVSASVIEPPSPMAVAEPLPICRRLGPLENEEQADRLTERLAGDVVRVHRRVETQSTIIGYVVLLETADRAEARQVTARLEENGIKDQMLLRKGPYTGQISVGVYTGKQTAERRRAQLAALGFEPRIRARIDEQAQIWLNLELQQDSANELALLGAVESVDPGLKVTLSSCREASHVADRVAHPDAL